MPDPEFSIVIQPAEGETAPTAVPVNVDDKGISDVAATAHDCPPQDAGGPDYAAYFSGLVNKEDPTLLQAIRADPHTPRRIDAILASIWRQPLSSSLVPVSTGDPALDAIANRLLRHLNAMDRCADTLAMNMPAEQLQHHADASLHVAEAFLPPEMTGAQEDSHADHYTEYGIVNDLRDNGLRRFP